MSEGISELSGVPPIDMPKATQLPPSKFDDAPPPRQETFGRDYVEELRTENKTWRGKLTTERAERERVERERDTATQSAKQAKEEAEATAHTRVTEAEQRANERIVRAELKAVAVKAGMIDLDGLKLADVSKVKLNDAGEVEGADELIEQLKQNKSYLFKATGGTSNTESPPKPDNPKPFDARTASPGEIQAWMKQHAPGYAFGRKYVR